LTPNPSRRYAFLFSESIPREVREVKAAMKRCSDEREKRRLEVRLSRLQQTLKADADARVAAEVEREWKAEERAAVATGKGVFHLKAGEKRRRVLAKQFESLKEAGQLDAFMAKRRKRNAAKDRRKLPVAE